MVDIAMLEQRDNPCGRQFPDQVLTILAVIDLARSVEFYRRVFGWTPRVEAPVYVELALPGGRGLGLYQREGFARNTGILPEQAHEGCITATELYFSCPDLEASLSRMEAVGARILSPLALRPWGHEAAYFADPDGNVLVLARVPS